MPASLSSTQKWFQTVCWVWVLIWVCTVFYLSSRSSEELQDLPFFVEAWDKVLHFTAFFCGVLPLVPALRLSFDWPWRKICLVAIAATSLYGALDEVHQLWTPNRSGM